MHVNVDGNMYVRMQIFRVINTHVRIWIFWVINTIAYGQVPASIPASAAVSHT